MWLNLSYWEFRHCMKKESAEVRMHQAKPQPLDTWCVEEGWGRSYEGQVKEEVQNLTPGWPSAQKRGILSTSSTLIPTGSCLCPREGMLSSKTLLSFLPGKRVIYFIEQKLGLWEEWEWDPGMTNEDTLMNCCFASVSSLNSCFCVGKGFPLNYSGQSISPFQNKAACWNLSHIHNHKQPHASRIRASI